MDYQFQEEKISCMRRIPAHTQTQEQTQELRLDEALPDIGRVLCAWGQVVLRGKEWRQESVGVNCGVKAWVLYAPEDGTAPQCVETWMQVNFRWDIPPVQRDGRISCQCALRSVDARILSGRKLMVRASVSVMPQIHIPEQTSVYTPAQCPADIQLLQHTYPVCLLQETGEKAFVLDEELTLPASAPAMESPVYYTLQPEIAECRVLGDKTVFRGTAGLHLLYKTPEGTVASWDTEIPFSQYAQLEREYSEEAGVQVSPAVTALELEAQQGRIRLKGSVSGQYAIYDRVTVTTAEDAYSLGRSVELEMAQVELPAVLQRQSQQMTLQEEAPFGGGQVADVAFYPDAPQCQEQDGQWVVEQPGLFQVLYYGDDGILQCASVHAREQWNVPSQEQVQLNLWSAPVGKAQGQIGHQSTAVQAQVQVEMQAEAQEKKNTVRAISGAQIAEKDPNRPSLILRKVGQEDLWNIAKKAGSTVEAIEKANHLQYQPDPDTVLIIPVM